MSKDELVQVITIICLQFKSEEDKVNCYDKIVNCAVTNDGNILTKEELINKCMKKGIIE
jgi:hypothetical protein